MSPIDCLHDELKKRIPKASFLSRKADDPNGFQHLNITFDNNLVEIAIDYKPSVGFGISRFDGNNRDSDGLFTCSQEFYVATAYKTVLLRATVLAMFALAELEPE